MLNKFLLYSRGIKILILGDWGVGKSALIIRLVCGRFLEEYDPTIEETYRKTLMIGGKHELLDILDTHYNPEFTIRRDFQWLRDQHNFMIVYNIQSMESFESAKIWYERVKDTHEDSGMNVVLVANKYDLYDENLISAQAMMRLTLQNIQDLVYGYMREAEKLCRNSSSIIPIDVKAICLSYHGGPMPAAVTRKMGQKLAKSWERSGYKVPYIETSAKTGHNVTEAFEKLVLLGRLVS